MPSDTYRICKVRKMEPYRQERMSNVHPSDEYHIKRTLDGREPDKKDEQDYKRKIIVHLNHIHVTLK